MNEKEDLLNSKISKKRKAFFNAKIAVCDQNYYFYHFHYYL